MSRKGNYNILRDWYNNEIKCTSHDYDTKSCRICLAEGLETINNSLNHLIKLLKLSEIDVSKVLYYLCYQKSIYGSSICFLIYEDKVYFSMRLSREEETIFVKQSAYNPTVLGIDLKDEAVFSNYSIFSLLEQYNKTTTDRMNRKGLFKSIEYYTAENFDKIVDDCIDD